MPATLRRGAERRESPKREQAATCWTAQEPGGSGAETIKSCLRARRRDDRKESAAYSQAVNARRKRPKAAGELPKILENAQQQEKKTSNMKISQRNTRFRQHFCRNFTKFQSKSSFFMPIFMKFHQNFAKISQNFDRFRKLVPIIFKFLKF